jgi:hypothetical protein
MEAGLLYQHFMASSFKKGSQSVKAPSGTLKHCALYNAERRARASVRFRVRFSFITMLVMPRDQLHVTCNTMGKCVHHNRE